MMGLVAGSELGAQAAKQAQGTVGLYLAEAVSRHEDVWILMLAAGKDKAEQKERDDGNDCFSHIHSCCSMYITEKIEVYCVFVEKNY